MLAVAYLHGLWGRITRKATSISRQYTFNPHIHVPTTILVLPKSTNSAHRALAMQLQSALRMGDWRGTVLSGKINKWWQHCRILFTTVTWILDETFIMIHNFRPTSLKLFDNCIINLIKLVIFQINSPNPKKQSHNPKTPAFLNTNLFAKLFYNFI